MKFRKRFYPSRPVLFLLGPALLIAAVLGHIPGHASAHEIRIAGTGSALGTMRRLVEGYRAGHSDIRTVVYPSLGSTGGIEALLAGRVDVAVSARPLAYGEIARGCREIPFARTPLVFAVHKDVEVRRLTIEEIAAIYGGETTRWRDGRRIRPILRPPSEIDISLLREISPGMKDAVDRALHREGAIVAMTDQEAANAIERTTGAIGVMTLALALAEQRSVRVLAVGEAEPSAGALANGRYPYFKSFYLVTRKKPLPVVARFVAFARSPAGSRILGKSGCIPFAKRPAA